MIGRETWAVVLVKTFRLAKQRLATVLDESQRVHLAHSMLEDVLCALDACGEQLSGVIVVTADEDAAALARRYSAVVLMETAAVGLNEALARVIDHLAARREAGIIVVPADLPHLSPFEIEEAVDLISRIPAVALVRASDGGTNLLACRPAGVIKPRFGPDSFNAHCVAAARAGVTPTVLFAPRLGLDIDRPDDLVAFMSLGSATRTHAYLSTLDLPPSPSRFAQQC